MALDHPKAVAGDLKECKDAKDEVQEHTLLVERERDDLTESVFL